MEVVIERASTGGADEIMVIQNAAFESDLKKYGECHTSLTSRSRKACHFEHSEKICFRVATLKKRIPRLCSE